MIDAASVALIEEQIARDGRSLLQYVGEADPYTPAPAEGARRRLTALARENQEAVGQLMRFLHRAHVTPPLLGTYPTNFTTINFVSLAHVLPALRKDQERGIAQLERGIAALPESDGRHLLWQYLEMKRRHLRELEAIARDDAEAERAQPSVIPSEKISH